MLMSTHPLAPEELQGGVDVAEVVWPPQHSASLHGQPLPTEDLQQGQQPHSVTEVIYQTLNLITEVINSSLGHLFVNRFTFIGGFLLQR